MRIAIIGCGFVGGTVADFLEKHTLKDGVEITRVDPKLDSVDVHELTSLDGAIICLNAPTVGNKVDVVLTQDSIYTLIRNNPGIEIMVKSTVPMFTELSTANIWPEQVVYNPEFLRQDTAEEDFANQEIFILGVAKHSITDDLSAEDNPHAKFWTNLFAPSLPNTNFVYTDRESAVMVKYTHNVWLATKVAFFHKLSTQMPGLSDYNEMTRILAQFPNIGSSHMGVPNADGGLGFGGGCFPKDIAAFSGFAGNEIVYAVEDVNHNLKKKERESLKNRVNFEAYKTEIPDEDYIIILGTSHTLGECTGTKINSFGYFLQADTGIKVVQIGYSGCTNNDLLQVTNELATLGFFNERCKLVLLEPRITENQQHVSLDAIFGEDFMLNWLERSGQRQHCLPEIGRTGLDMEVENKQRLQFKTTILNEVLRRVGFATCEKQTVFDKALLNHIDPDNSLAGVELKFVQQCLKEHGPGAREAAQYALAFGNSSMKARHSDISIIEAISHIVKNAGVPFRWFLVDNRHYELHYLRFVLNSTTNIFKEMLLTTPVQSLMTKRNGVELHRDQGPKFICGCGHFNEHSNKIIAEEFLTPAVDKILTKLKEL